MMGLKKHLKRLNGPEHWMLDKLGGAFVRSRIFLSMLYTHPLIPSVGLYLEHTHSCHSLRMSCCELAPKPSSGPHKKARECLPLILIIRNRLKYALTYCEVIAIMMQRRILVDGKARIDETFPAGFMDVVSIPETNENFQLLYDTKGHFHLHSIYDEEGKIKILMHFRNQKSSNDNHCSSFLLDFFHFTYNPFISKCCLVKQFKLCKVCSVQFGNKGIPYLNTYDGLHSLSRFFS
ncbi:putative ribosomal protein S4e [Dioscorea sansibarensis]